MNAQSLPICYRHHDRETRLSCTNCGRPVCAECVRFAEVGQRCPDCAPAPRATATGGATGLTEAPGTASPVTFVILGTCVGIFLLGLFLPAVWRVLFAYGAQANVAVAAGEWWRPITAAFLHADIPHILFNMWALYLFGPPLEREAGSLSFAGLYVAAVLAGGAAFFVLQPDGVAVGASGAIFGLFGAWLAAAIRNRKHPRGREGLNQLLVLLGINIALPLFVPRIAWQAHLGGFAAGFAIAAAWLVINRRGGNAMHRALAAVAIGAMALSFLA